MQERAGTLRLADGSDHPRWSEALSSVPAQLVLAAPPHAPPLPAGSAAAARAAAAAATAAAAAAAIAALTAAAAAAAQPATATGAAATLASAPPGGGSGDKGEVTSGGEQDPALEAARQLEAPQLDTSPEPLPRPSP